jgi:hypothetical protein
MKDTRNVDQLKADIDSGKAGDKIAWPDPAMAPLGTDDEAAGTPPTPDSGEGGKPPGDRRRSNFGRAGR